MIAGLAFINYVLLKIYGTPGIYFSGFLGGLVNSSAAAAQNPALFRRLALFTFVLCLLGLVILTLREFHWLRSL